MLVGICSYAVFAKKNNSERDKSGQKVPAGMFYVDGSDGQSGFYMNMNQVSNDDYRRFIAWVKDSVLRERLSEGDPSYKTINARGDTVLNWKKKIPRKPKGMWERYVIKSMIEYSSADFLNPEYTYYKFSYSDKSHAEKWKQESTGRPDSIRVDSFYINSKKRFDYDCKMKRINGESDFIYPMIIPVGIDKSCWNNIDAHEEIKNKISEYSNIRFMNTGYFSYAIYKKYPVVGVSWYQAIAYCNWLNKSGQTKISGGEYSLPTEEEWMRAATRAEELANSWPTKTKHDKEKKSQFAEYGRNLHMRNLSDTTKSDNSMLNCDHAWDLLWNVKDWTSAVSDTLIKSVVTVQRKVEDVTGKVPACALHRYRVVKGGSFVDLNYNHRDRVAYHIQSCEPFVGFRLIWRPRNKE